MITVTPYSYLSQEPTSLLQSVFGHNPLITSVEMHNTVLKRFLVIIFNKACHCCFVVLLYFFWKAENLKKWKKKGKRFFCSQNFFIVRLFFYVFLIHEHAFFSNPCIFSGMKD